MGYIKHDTIVVTAWADIAAIHGKAVELLGDIGGANPDRGINLVSPIVGPFVNGQASFFVAPDGSKEGWDTSDNAEAARRDFLDWFQRDCRTYAQALVARFGGDDDQTTVSVLRSAAGE